MSNDALWSLEIEWEDATHEYLSVDSVVIIGDTVRFELIDGSIIETDRSDVRKVLVMRTIPKKSQAKPKTNKKSK